MCEGVGWVDQGQPPGRGSVQARWREGGAKEPSVGIWMGSVTLLGGLGHALAQLSLGLPVL